MDSIKNFFLIFFLLIATNAGAVGTWNCSEDEDDTDYAISTFFVEVTDGTSGTPATFADFVTADRAGTAVLLEAVAVSLNETLTEQIRPVEDLAITITFTIASKTADADFLWITGTDWDGVAQTEDIDISAGDGAYNSTLKYQTITAIDCDDTTGTVEGTVCADGTIKVEQDRWGLIWDKGNSQYRVDAHLEIGDFSTATYFLTTREMITFPAHIMRTTTNATFNIGVASNNWGTAGSYIHFTTTNVAPNKYSIYGGTVNVYASLLSADGINGFYMRDAAASIKMRNTILDPRMTSSTLFLSGSADLEAVYKSNEVFDIRIDPSNFANVQIENIVSSEPAIVANSGIGTVSDTLITNTSGEDYGTGNATLNVIDPVDIITTPQTTNTGYLYEKFTVNIHVVDKDGADVVTANVTCNDKFGTSVFDVNTDGSGDIAEQTVTSRYWTGIAEVLIDYNPHTFVISKAGYRTQTVVYNFSDNKAKWEIELADGDTVIYDSTIYDSTIY